MVKDPSKSQPTQNETDPRMVSAYSVYNGLVPGLKSYQDTSESSSASKRRKAKRRQKRSSGAGEGKVETEANANAKNETAAQSVNKPPKKSLQLPKTPTSNPANATNGSASNRKATPAKKDQKNKGSQPQPSRQSQSSEDAVIADTSNAENSSKKKKKRKKNKKKQSDSNQSLTESQSAARNGLNDSTIVNLSAFSSDDEDEPPAKNLKLVPNPLATDRNSTRRRSQVNAKSSVVNNKKNLNLQLGKGNMVNNGAGSTSKSMSLLVKNGIPPAVASTSKKANEAKTSNSKGQGKGRNVSSKFQTSTVESKTPPPDRKTIFNNKRVEDSVNYGKSVFEWLIHPVSVEEFMNNYWEKKPLLIKRKHDDSEKYYQWILTTQIFDDVLRRNTVKYGVNLDITSYTDGVRETLSENMHGRVRPAVVWDYYNNGCSVRMLNPQSYVQQLWRVNSALQEWFGSFVGANMYLTPPDSQGFAPHYDDIDAFILQVEGKKQWKLYNSRKEDESLPRFSSGNFSETSDNLGEPILDIVLEEGDLLYFPRGMIHQAKTVDGEHSLHLTLSCNQLNTYGDLLKHHLNHTLEKLMSEDINFRKGLPTDYMSYMGIAHKNTGDPELKKKRLQFTKTIEGLMTKFVKEPADFAADAMAKKFIWDSLPPFLTSMDRETCVAEDGEFMQSGRVFNRVEFGPETEVKFVRKHCIRLVVEEGLLRLYYNSENSLVYHEEETQFLELPVEMSPAVNHLISKYPEFTPIEELPLSSEDIGEKVQLISDLWERGLILTKEPLEPCDDIEIESADESNDSFPNEEKETVEESDEVESVNLSDLPEEDTSENESLNDEFYETSVMDLEEDDDDEDDEDDDDDEEESGSSSGSSETSYDSVDQYLMLQGEEDEDEDVGEEESEVDSVEFDRMDQMEDDSDDDD